MRGMAIRLLLAACVWTTFATSKKVVMEIPRKYKTGGAMPNTCGTWNYGTTGRVGESMNPQCKSTEMDTGTTGIAQLTSLPVEARAFTQTVKISETNLKCSDTPTGCNGQRANYEMTTNYWNDAPCRSGEMFTRCNTAILTNQIAGCDRKTQQADGTLVTDASGNLQQYTGTAPNAKQCAKYCCRSECPQQTCTVATDHDTCPTGSATSCPMWPQCLNIGDGCSKVLPCSGMSGDIANGGAMCAFWYPGCGAVNGYSSMSYNGGAAENVMTIRAYGSVLDLTEANSALTWTDRMDNLCGANNNLFSFAPSGSAQVLQNAASYVDRTSNVNGACESGHPTYCECSRLGEIQLTGIQITIHDSALLSTFNGQCSSSCTGLSGNVALGQTVTLSAGCSSSNCPFLSSIGYADPTQHYFVQYYRPWEEENILYIGEQSSTMAGALGLKIHSEGVYELNKPCGACTLRAPTMLITVFVSLLGWLLARAH